MVRIPACVVLAGCIGVSADSPNGGYGIVTMRVAPPEGPAHTVEEAGRFEFGSLGNTNDPLACSDSGAFCGDAVSIVAYEWVGTGLVPVWAPERVLFELPEWDGPNDVFLGRIPVGNLSCALGRTQRRPTILVADDCAGPDAGGFAVELVLDR